MTTSHFPAGCFGKLPQFGDFVKHNASSGEMLAFDQWLQQGMQFAQRHFNQSWDQAYQQAPAYHFLFYADRPARLLLGLLQPSCDKSMRKYPFWISLTVEKTKLSEAVVSALPAAFSTFFAQARQLLHNVRNELERRDLGGRIEKLKVEFPGALDAEAREHQSQLTAMTSEHLWRGLFDRFDDRRKYLLFKNLTEILLPYRGRDAAKLMLGLRFPLMADAARREHEVNFWLQATQQLLRDPDFLPLLFWSAPEGKKRPYLFLFFRPPAVKNFVQLVQPDLPSDIICELEEEGRDKIDSARSALLAPFHALLETPAMTLRTVLMRL